MRASLEREVARTILHGGLFPLSVFPNYLDQIPVALLRGEIAARGPKEAFPKGQGFLSFQNELSSRDVGVAVGMDDIGIIHKSEARDGDSALPDEGPFRISISMLLEYFDKDCRNSIPSGRASTVSLKNTLRAVS